MKTLKIALILIAVVVVGCNKLGETTPTTTKSVSLSTAGFTDFGHLLVGTYLDYSYLIASNTSNTDESIDMSSIASPFSVILATPSKCTSTKVPANTSCWYRLKFFPTVSGSYSARVSFGAGSVEFKGSGVKQGVAQIELYNTLLDTYTTANAVDIGTVPAGSSTFVSFFLHNISDLPIAYPDISTDVNSSVSYNTCPDVLEADKRCEVGFLVTPLTAGALASSLSVTMPPDSAKVFSVTGSVLPATPYGLVTINYPSGINGIVPNVSKNLAGVAMTAGKMMDKNGNTVSTGTQFYVSSSNSRIVDNTCQSTALPSCSSTSDSSNSRCVLIPSCHTADRGSSDLTCSAITDSSSCSGALDERGVTCQWSASDTCVAECEGINSMNTCLTRTDMNGEQACVWKNNLSGGGCYSSKNIILTDSNGMVNFTLDILGVAGQGYITVRSSDNVACGTRSFIAL